MSLAIRLPTLASAILLATLVLSCEEDAKKEAPAAKPSASVAAVAPAPPAPSAEPPKLRDDCPDGSSGVGTMAQPCLGKGDSRMMEVAYSGKTTDEGPKFSIINKSKSPILYGSLAAYFYDKAGKQLDVTSGGKPQPMQLCSGRIFAGVVKPGEKIYMFFSCVKKADIPKARPRSKPRSRRSGSAMKPATRASITGPIRIWFPPNAQRAARSRPRKSSRASLERAGPERRANLVQGRERGRRRS